MAKPTITVIAPGAMGSAVARRLTEAGATVLTSLSGRSAAARQRAAAAGMIDADDETIARSDVLLSVVPPAQAVALAERFAEALSGASRKAVFVDCNAVNVETVKRIAAIVAPSGATFVDAGIIGAPPGPKGDPTFYLSGEAASSLGYLADFGLKTQVLQAPIGAASALKMSYAGINKGLTLLTAAMVMGAARAGATDALRAELAASQPQLLARAARALPDMYPKAERWGPEMEEIADFLSDDPAARTVFEGMAALCRRLAADRAGEAKEIAQLDAFVALASASIQ